MAADFEQLKAEHERLKTEHERLKLLYQVSNVIHSTLDQQVAFQLIVTEAVRVTGASSGSVVLHNPTTGFLEIQAFHGLPKNASELRLRLDEGITGWVARHGRPARVGDVTRDPRYIMARPNVRSELAVPLEVGGETRGVLNVDSDRPEAFSAADEELLQALSGQAATVIEKTWVHEQSKLKAQLFESLISVSGTINSTLNLEEGLRVITREACQLMEAKMSSLLMLDETGEWLDLRASYGAGPAYLAKPRLSVAESFLGFVVRRRKPMQMENVQLSSRYQSAEIARKEGLVSLLSVPLVFADQAIGALSVYIGRPYSFSNEEIRMLTALAGLSAVAIEKARLYERVVDVEEQLRQSEKLSAIGLLAAEIAHEIRNPLTVMKMLYHSLALSFPLADPRNKDAQVIGEKMDHLNKIVEQILDFARSAEPDFKLVNVNQLLEDLFLLTRHKLTNHQIQLVRKLEPATPLLTADATQLEQAFLNLTLNAVEAMPSGGKLTITTRVSQTAGHSPAKYLYVEFRDTGHGMTAEQQQRLFSSLLSTTKPKGTGIGLAIVSKVIEAHRGKIKVRSKVGLGTAITLILPF